MRLVVAADHGAVPEKAAVVEALRAAGHEVTDLGTHDTESVDYPDFSAPAARTVAAGDADRGVLLCTTGVGQCMVANKVPGVRAVVLWNDRTAEMSRRHNNANVACFGAALTDVDEMIRMLGIWLETPFDGGRHERRVGKINALDS